MNLQFVGASKHYNIRYTILFFINAIFLIILSFLQISISNLHNSSLFLINLTTNKELNSLDDFFFTCNEITNKIESLKGSSYTLLSQIRLTQKLFLEEKDKKIIASKSSLLSNDLELLYNENKEDETNFGSNKYNKELSYLGKGGFVLQKVPNELQCDKTNSFFHSQEDKIKSIIMDFALYNDQIDYIIHYEIQYNKKLDLGSDISVNLHYIKKNSYNNKLGIFRAIIECLFFIFTTVFFIYNLVNHIRSKKTSCISKLYNDMSLVIYYISFLMSIISIGLWIAFIIIKNKDKTAFKNAITNKEQMSPATLNNCVLLHKLFNLYMIFLGLTHLLYLLLLVKVISFYVTSIRAIVKSLSDSIGTIIAFLLIYISFILGMTVFTWMYYGRYISTFSSLSDSFNFNVAVSFGILNNNTVTNMHQKSNAITVIYFILIALLIHAVIFDVLIILLSNHFRNISNTFSVQDSIKRKANSKGSLLLKLVICYRDKTGCKCKGTKKQVKDISILRSSNAGDSRIEMEEIQQNFKCNRMREELKGRFHFDNYDNNINNALFKKGKIKNGEEILSEELNAKINASYDEDYKFTQRDCYFESEINKNAIFAYYNKKYKIIILVTFLYIIFLICFIFMVYYTINSSWLSNIKQILNENNLPNYIQNIQNDKNELAKFITTEIPTYFSDNNELNKIINDSLIITFKTEKYKEHYYKILDNVYLNYENYLSVDREEGYTSLITFTELKTKQENDLSNFISNNENANISSIYIEAFSMNDRHKIFIYTKFQFSFIEGGTISYSMKSDFTRTNESYQPFDSIKYSFLALSIIFFILIIIIFISVNEKNWKHYTQWYYDTIYNLSSNLKQLRNKKEKEIVRKVKSIILTFDNILDILIIILFLFVLYHILVLLVKENSLKLTQNNIYTIRDNIYKISYSRKALTVYSCIFIFIGALRVSSQILKYTRYFKIIRMTLLYGSVNLLPLILVLILVHPAFILFNHFTLGQYIQEFNKADVSVLTQILMLFGYIDLSRLTQQNYSIGCILYYIYIIFIYTILSNYFIAIMFQTYYYVKKEKAPFREQLTWKGLLCPDSVNNNHSKKNLASKRLEINNEFSYNLQQEITFQKIEETPSTLLIPKANNISIDDWLKHEESAIRDIDLILNNLSQKKKDVDVAYISASFRDNEPLIEESFFNGISETQWKCFNILMMRALMSINNNLRNDCVNLKEKREILQEISELINYDVLTEKTRQTSMMLRNKINEIDNCFVEAKRNLDSVMKIKDDQNLITENADNISKENQKDNLLKTIHLDLDNAKGMIQPIDADNEINSINLSHDNQ